VNSAIGNCVIPIRYVRLEDMADQIRQCAFCKKPSHPIDTEDQVMDGYDTDSEAFKFCMYGSSWELCKDVGSAAYSGLYLYTEGGKAIGRFRELQ
jgi:hypothetical protein